MRVGSCDGHLVRNSRQRIRDRARDIIPGAGNVWRRRGGAAQILRDYLALAEDVQSIRVHRPAGAKRLLHAERRLLEQWVVRIFVVNDDSHATCLPLAAERVRKCGTARRKPYTGNWREARIKIRWRRIAGKCAGGTRIFIDGERAVVLHALVARNLKNDSVVIDAEAAANHGFSASEWVIGKAHAWSEIFSVWMMANVNDARHPGARDGRLRRKVGARAVRRAGAGRVGIVIPAQAEIQSQVARDAPIVLREQSDVTIDDVGNGNGLDRRGALDRNGNGYIQIVYHAVSIQICKSEIRREHHAAAAKHVDLTERLGILILPAQMQCVLSQSPGKRVSYLIAIQVRGLRDVEVHAIGNIRINQFVRRSQARGIRAGRAIGKFGNVVQERIEVKDQVIYLGRGKSFRPTTDHRIETVQRILPFRLGE